MSERELPEGVIDANPPGGWESEDVADAETAQQSADAQGSGELAESGLSADGTVETDEISQGADPDLSTEDEDA